MNDFITEIQQAMGTLWKQSRLGAKRIVIGSAGLAAWQEVEDLMTALNWQDPSSFPGRKISSIYNPYDNTFVPVALNAELPYCFVIESRPAVVMVSNATP